MANAPLPQPNFPQLVQGIAMVTSSIFMLSNAFQSAMADGEITFKEWGRIITTLLMTLPMLIPTLTTVIT